MIDALLTAALRAKYEVLPVTRAMGRGGRVLMLRHDVDISLSAAIELAVYEHDIGVRATYFVQVTSPFYSATSDRGISSLVWLRDLGHEVGLHYDAGSKVGLASQAVLFSELVGNRDWPISLHSPTVVCPPGSVGLMSQVTSGVNVNGPEVQTTFKYVTDSLMVWRQDPLQIFSGGGPVQLLLHPEHYTEEAPFADFRAAYWSAVETTDMARDRDLEAFFRGADASIANRGRLDPLVMQQMLGGV